MAILRDLENIGNIPVSTQVAASLFPDLEARNQKVSNLEDAGKFIRIKKGPYLVDPKILREAPSTELIANHLYAPSYISMQTALHYYGLITVAVYTLRGYNFLLFNLFVNIFAN